MGGLPAAGQTSQPFDPQRAVHSLSGEGAPGDDWNHFWCGMIEDGIEYSVVAGSWESKIEQSKSPDWCCRICQRQPECQSWTWVRYAGSGPKGSGSCSLWGGGPASK